MLKVVKRYGFLLILNSLFLLPAAIYGQDLGSSGGLFRSPNPSSKSGSGNSSANKKNTPKPKNSAVKTASTKKDTGKAVSKTNNVPSRSVKNSRKKVEISKAKPNTTVAKEPVKTAPPTNIIINVGQPTTGNYDELYERAIDEGNNARDERNYVAAENAYSRAKSLKSSDSRAVYGLGNIFSDQQRWEEAEKAYRQAIQLEPNSPEAYIALSFVLTQPVVGASLGDRFIEAEKMARKAIQLDGKNAIAYDQLGVSLELQGSIGAETQTAYRRAIEFAPDFALAYAHLGRLLRRNGKSNDSSAAYQDAIRLALDVPTMILVADVMQSQQRYDESEQLLRRALREDPKNPTALFLLGRALTTRGIFDEAEKVLKKSVDISPNSFVSYTLLSSLYARRNNLDEAERVLLRALNVVSVNEKKRLSQEFEFVGDGFMKAGRSRDAARVYQRAITLDGDNALLTNKLNKAQKS